ncbi:MAG TPA: type II toxin-antitoxin system ParD family antitoxin [Sphingomicrobium sp.]|jgi:antitoxin ParD1/3/4|nr:type II toxin-antitoxin system ParD family antitoxin [Sphingomicrobium sp.]
MAARANKPISVTLGPFAEKVERRVKEGHYASASEVVRDALRALDREDELFDEILREKVKEALADPRPSISSEEVDGSIQEWYQAALKRGS